MRCALIVEDDAYKLDALSEVLRSAAQDIRLTTCRSVQSAVSEIASADFDIIILDMSLPSHDPEKGSMLGIPRLSGGVEVLFELDYLSKKTNVIIVTQYPEIEMSGELVSLDQVPDFVLREYGIEVISCLYYDADNDIWKRRMLDTLGKVDFR